MSQNYEPKYFYHFLKPVDGNEGQLTGSMLVRQEKWTQSYQHVCLYCYSTAPMYSIESEAEVFEPFDYAASLLDKCVGQVVGMYVDVNSSSGFSRPVFEKMLNDVKTNGIEVVACRTLSDLSAGDPQVLETIMELERQQGVKIMLTKPLEGDNQLWAKMLAALLSLNRKAQEA